MSTMKDEIRKEGKVFSRKKGRKVAESQISI